MHMNCSKAGIHKQSNLTTPHLALEFAGYVSESSHDSFKVFTITVDEAEQVRLLGSSKDLGSSLEKVHVQGSSPDNKRIMTHTCMHVHLHMCI